MLNEIELQLKEMFTRSQNFESFLEKADLKKGSNNETDRMVQKLKTKI